MRVSGCMSAVGSDPTADSTQPFRPVSAPADCCNTTQCLGELELNEPFTGLLVRVVNALLTRTMIYLILYELVY